MKKWQFNIALMEIIDGKIADALKSMNGKKGTKCGDLKMDERHAGWACNKDPEKKRESILCLTEGKLAKSLPNAMMAHLPEGPNIIGYLPLRGKIINARNIKKIKQILNNREIWAIQQMLGLEEGDTDPEKLNYGHVMIMNDSDWDGYHICALLLNLFYVDGQSLLGRGLF